MPKTVARYTSVLPSIFRLDSEDDQHSINENPHPQVQVTVRDKEEQEKTYSPISTFKSTFGQVQRVVDVWYGMPVDVIEADTITTFTQHLDWYMDSKGLEPDGSNMELV